MNLRVVELQRNAGQDAQIGRADHQHVDAGHLRDGFGIFQRLGRFDLHDEQRVLVGSFEILGQRNGAVGGVGIGAVDTAFAFGPELGPAHHFGGFFGRLAAGIHDALGAGFEQASHAACIRPWRGGR